MGTIRKVIGALLLVTAILVTQIPAVETSAAPNSDFQIDKTKLVKYTGTATSVSIPSTVKTIEDGKMTKDLALITTLENVEVLSSLDFIKAVRATLETM